MFQRLYRSNTCPHELYTPEATPRSFAALTLSLPLQFYDDRFIQFVSPAYVQRLEPPGKPQRKYSEGDRPGEWASHGMSSRS